MDIKVGSPYLWKSGIYGDVAVHVESIYNGLPKVTVDGGEASRQVREHPELADGWFVIASRLVKRPSKARKAPERVLAEKAGIAPADQRIPVYVIDESKPLGERMTKHTAVVENTIREVPGIGKVAVITMDPPKTTVQRNKRRLSFLQALDAADDLRGKFNWAQPGSASTEITF